LVFLKFGCRGEYGKVHYVLCIYNLFGKEITKYMVIYGVYIYGSGQVAKYIEVPSAEARQSPCGQN